MGHQHSWRHIRTSISVHVWLIRMNRLQISQDASSLVCYCRYIDWGSECIIHEITRTVRQGSTGPSNNLFFV